MVLRFFQTRQKYNRTNVMIKNKKLSGFIADTPLKRMIGLMYREKLAARECMLFVFDKIGKHSIWMLNMRFPIDVIWLDERKKIVHMEENLPPCKNALHCKTYIPKENAKYILELSHGFISKNKIAKSSTIIF